MDAVIDIPEGRDGRRAIPPKLEFNTVSFGLLNKGSFQQRCGNGLKVHIFGGETSIAYLGHGNISAKVA